MLSAVKVHIIFELIELTWAAKRPFKVYVTYYKLWTASVFNSFLKCLVLAAALWGCSTGADPITNSVTLGLVAKVGRQGSKSRNSSENMLGRLHLPTMKKYKLACLDHDPNLTWGRDDFLKDKMGSYQDKL